MTIIKNMVTQLQETNIKQNNLYDTDFCLWIEATAKQLKQKKFNELDLANLIEEIEYMGKKEKKSLESNLEILIMHLLKYKYQPEKRTNSWRYTIIEHRNRIAKSFKYSPSLKRHYQDVFVECYQVARKFASNETGLKLRIFPELSPFSLEQILDQEYLPE